MAPTAPTGKAFCAFRRDLPGRPVSGDFGHREGLFQPDQSQRTGHRIKYAKVDADTVRGSGSRDIMKGYKIDHRHLHRGVEGRTRRHRAGIDPHHRDRRIRAEDRYRQPLSDPPYYLVAGRQGRPRRVRGDPRETIKSMNKVAIGRVVLTNREHFIALEPLDRA